MRVIEALCAVAAGLAGLGLSAAVLTFLLLSGAVPFGTIDSIQDATVMDFGSGVFAVLTCGTGLFCARMASEEQAWEDRQNG